MLDGRSSSGKCCLTQAASRPEIGWFECIFKGSYVVDIFSDMFSMIVFFVSRLGICACMCVCAYCLFVETSSTFFLHLSWFAAESYHVRLCFV